MMFTWRPDRYTLQARVLPVFILLWPLGLAAAAWIPGSTPTEQIASSLLAPALVSMLAGQLGRDLGYTRQPRLWARWGGAPTTQLLRHRSTQANSELRRRYHRLLEQLDPTLRMPTAAQEEANPAEADAKYEQATRVLISRVRADPALSRLVFKENVNYGFRRNLWGMRPIGLPLSLLCAGACLSQVWLAPDSVLPLHLDWAVPTVLCVLLALLWLFRFTRSWVRIPAQAYAERLFECLETLVPASGSVKQLIL